jgi:muramoyltetrapeptide carboxypeptidase
VSRLRKPRAIAPGATLGIAAPGGPIEPELLARGTERLRAAGFRVVHRDDVVARYGYLAGDDARRIEELSELVVDPSVDAIVCGRGGYGCDRILDALDAEAFRTARKPIVGYSDVTALLLWLERRAGLLGFHGPMLDGDAESLRELADQLTGVATPPFSMGGRGRGGGRAEGRLVGGNLMLVTASIGTSWEIDTRGAILLLEEVNELPYRIDRMLQQLRGARKLDGLAGIGLGDVSSCCDDRYPELDTLTVIEQITKPRGLPLVTDLPFGHGERNQPWPFGARATIDADRGEVRIHEAGVAGVTGKS